MNTCKICLNLAITDYDVCLRCYEKNHTQTNMEKTIEDYQKEINTLQATVNGDGFNIKRLSEENEKLRSELECYKKNGDTCMTCYEKQNPPKNIMEKTIEAYKEALEEIAKKNRKAETCRLIALKVLGRLNDYYQPELLVEENLKLKMKVEDLESKIVGYTIDKVFNPENVPLKDWEGNPITHCKDCGEYWGYHHEEYCKAKVLDNTDKPEPRIWDVWLHMEGKVIRNNSNKWYSPNEWKQIKVQEVLE